MLLRERDRRLVRRLPVDLAIIDRIPGEEAVAACEPVIDASLPEVLVDRLCWREQIFRRASAERAAVGPREEGLQVRRNRRMQRDGPCRQDAQAGVVVRHRGQTTDAQTLDEPFERGKEKGPIFPERAAQRAAELVAKEIRDRLVLRIEEILRVERGVAMELEARAVQRVRP